MLGVEKLVSADSVSERPHSFRVFRWFKSSRYHCSAPVKQVFSCQTCAHVKLPQFKLYMADRLFISGQRGGERREGLREMFINDFGWNGPVRISAAIGIETK